MKKLWEYKDYINHLSHKNSLVRRWAFNAIENQYSNRYTDEVSNLIGDEDEHLACSAPKYLAKHAATQHAPAIIESFNNGQNNIPSNCASALAKMKYEPALESIIGSLSTNIKSNSLFGIFDYLGSVCNEDSRDTLISAIQIKDSFLQGCAFQNLLKHNHPEDVPLILKIILNSVEDSQIKSIADFWGVREYINDLTIHLEGQNIIKNPKAVLELFFKRNDHLFVKTDKVDMLIDSLEKSQYHDLVTTLMFEIQNILQNRYLKNSSVKDGRNFVQDNMAVALLKELSKQPSIWRKLKKNGNSGIDLLVPLVISVWFSVLERNIYLKALLPDAELEELIRAVKKTGSKFPHKLCKKIVALSPIQELKDALSEKLNTWGDIWIVKIMGQIGNKEFVPDLFRVINNTDGMDFIHEDAICSISAMDESADEIILTAIQNKEIGDWDSFSIIEHLPYFESFDLIIQKWEDENCKMNSYETIAYCLRGIGDERGIKFLQNIYNKDNDANYIGDPLECLCLIHNINIPELPAIHKTREENTKRQKDREREFDDIFNSMGNIKNKGNIIPFKRETKKVGRNEPCPCGSGKKYKKCCLNK